MRVDTYLAACAVTIVVNLSAGQVVHSRSLQGQTMTSLSPRLQAVFASTKSICFGRFVIDVPFSATVAFGPSEVEARMTHIPNGAESTTRRLAQLLKDVETDREFLRDEDFKRMPLFGKVLEGAVPGQKIVFGSRDHATYSIHSLIPLEKELFIHHVDSALPTESEVERLVGNFNRIASNLKLRDVNEIPSEQGVCIEGGFVPLDLKRERVTLGIRLREFPDVHFSVSAHKNLDRLRESSDLENLFKKGRQRAEQEGQGALHARIQMLRQGRRQLRDWNGYELLLRMPVYEGHTAAHEFRFHSLGTANDALKPQLDVQLDTGVGNNHKAAVKPSLLDEEAIGYWEVMIGSIRVRQPSDSRRNDASIRKTPIGHLSPSGALCTETGWWQCNESGSAKNTAQQHFSVGEVFPNAMLFAKANLWQKIMGEQPLLERATVWKLMTYELLSSDGEIE